VTPRSESTILPALIRRAMTLPHEPKNGV
jgi:hypothetical protein